MTRQRPHTLTARPTRSRHARAGDLGIRALLAISAALSLAAFDAVAPLAAAEPSGTVEKTAEKSAPATPRGVELFTTHVREILTQNCVKCHGGKKTEGEFDLTTREGLLKGGSEGPAVALGKAEDSRLYKLITHDEEPKMPDGAEKLSDQSIAHIAEWINAGAPYDKPLVEGTKKGHPTVTEQDRRFWSFQPLRRATPPPVRGEAWCRTPIDRFVLARLEEHGLRPNPVGTAVGSFAALILI
jgi:mono/diheme cytochrome c family protein